MFPDSENIQIKEAELSLLSKDIVRTLIYFDIFDYPLLKKELIKNCSIPGAKEKDLDLELQNLVINGMVKKIEKFYLIGENKLIERRLKGNLLAEKRLHTAKKISRFISHFPFVKCICLSGSISKGYMDKNSDIDYFIVTTPGRLWLCRTLLIFFKKIFLFNSRKYFCLNYFIDTNHLEIPDKNIFTAKELKYLIPVYNEEVYSNILKKNTWSSSFLPNFHTTYYTSFQERKSFGKRWGEKIFSGSLGEKLDTFCMKLTEAFWKIKFRKIRQNEDIRIRCAKHVSKFHPRNFQVKVLEKFERKVKVFEEQYRVKLDL